MATTGTELRSGRQLASAAQATAASQAEQEIAPAVDNLGNNNDQSDSLIDIDIEGNAPVGNHNQNAQGGAAYDRTPINTPVPNLDLALVTETVTRSVMSQVVPLVQRVSEDIANRNNNNADLQVVEKPVSRPTEPSVPSSVQIIPDPFDGTTSWADYYVRFELTAEQNGWNEATKARWLGSKLRGEAERVLSDLDIASARKYSCVVEALETRFGTSGKSDLYEALLQQRKRKPNEPLPTLAQDIRRLVKLAKPGISNTLIEKESISYFMAALNDANMAYGIKLYKNPQTLNDCVIDVIRAQTLDPSRHNQEATKCRKIQFAEAAKEMETKAPTQTEIMQQYVDQAVERSHQLLENHMKQLSCQVERLSRRDRSHSLPARGFGSKDERGRSNDRSNRNCFTCGKPGHIAKYCRMPSATLPRSSASPGRSTETQSKN